MSHVTEVVVFRLQDGVDEADFLKSAQATFDLLQSYDGYINRELSVSDDGVWVDVVTWADKATALQAAEAIMSDPIGQAFGGKIALESAQMHHVHPRISHMPATP